MSMLRLFFALSLICGVAYPLVVTGIAQALFPTKSQGSMVMRDGKVVGSSLLAQKFEKLEYFWSRPSAVDFTTIPSAASQASSTHKAAYEARVARQAALPSADVDAWTTSGSGLDPHVSPKTAMAQVERVAAARGVTSEAVVALINEHTEGETLGIWGRPRVNVLELNLALDRK